MNMMSVALIRPYDKNAKKHPRKQVELVAKSIQEFGFNQPVVVDRDGVLIVGHGRFEAAKLLGLLEVPAVVLDLTEEQAKAYRIADNKLNESEWDMDLVIEELKELSSDLLEITGFDADLLLDPEEKDDDTPETPVVAQSKYGDLYQLGEHRLLCGDSTKTEDVAKLMDGRMIDALFTDPPYNVDYKGTGKNTKEGIMNDKMSDSAFQDFLVAFLTTLKPFLKSGAGMYVFHSHKTAGDFEKALISTGYRIDTQLIWNKPAAGLGMNDYRTKHEPFFYCYQEGGKKNFYGDRTGTTVWKIPADDKKAFEWFKRENSAQEGGVSTVWTMKRANVAEYVHPTQKPAELACKAITNSSKSGDIVADMFLGSGTTMIACEKTNRSCYGLELDPKFVDVIVERWCNFTETKEVIKNGKKIIWEKANHSSSTKPGTSKSTSKDLGLILSEN